MSAWNPALISINQARIWPPEMAALTIKQSKRPLFIMGSLLNIIPEKITEKSIKVAKKSNATVVATGGSNLALDKFEFKPDYTTGAVEIINNLKNPDWKGFDGKGNYDLVLFIGVPYYLGSQGLSTLKNFAPHIKTLTLCRFMHPNADMSYPNIPYEEWLDWLSKLIDHLDQ
ncbi:MAG: CO dehydrogenase/acetyl-CoA synthase complex subunit epsilon [Methanobacterium sp.]|jgi:acetyl-CoA decarbonylase/synthase complex subunit epsilon